MLEEIKNIKSEKSDMRKFGIAIGVILLVIAGFLFWKEKELYQIFLTVGPLLFVLGFLMPALLKPIYWIWMLLATLIGWIMTRVILSLLFYIIITPIGLISRFFGKQFLELQWNKSKISYWNSIKTKELHEKNYEKQF